MGNLRKSFARLKGRNKSLLMPDPEPTSLAVLYYSGLVKAKPNCQSIYIQKGKMIPASYGDTLKYLRRHRRKGARYSVLKQYSALDGRIQEDLDNFMKSMRDEQPEARWSIASIEIRHQNSQGFAKLRNNQEEIVHVILQSHPRPQDDSKRHNRDTIEPNEVVTYPSRRTSRTRNRPSTPFRPRAAIMDRPEYWDSAVRNLYRDRSRSSWKSERLDSAVTRGRTGSRSRFRATRTESSPRTERDEDRGPRQVRITRHRHSYTDSDTDRDRRRRNDSPAYQH